MNIILILISVCGLLKIVEMAVPVTPKDRVPALIVIDMSEEQFHPRGSTPLPNWPGLANILQLAKRLPSSRVFDSRLWMSSEDNSSLHILHPFVGHKGAKGAELTKELRVLENLSTFVKKVQYSSFFGSDLHESLQAQKVNVILLTGINTDYCVISTAIDAFYLGYEVWLIEDATASIVSGSKGHKHGIQDFERFLGFFGKVLTTKDALKEIASK